MAARRRIVPDEINVILQAHAAVGRNALRIIDFILMNNLFVNDQNLDNFYRTNDRSKTARRINGILKKENVG